LAKSLIFFVTAITVVLLDLATKMWVRSTLAIGESVPEDWPVRLTHVNNTGAAFGLFQDRSFIFVIIAVVAVVLIFYYYRRLSADAWVIRFGLGLQLGGAIGNLIDRIWFGHVTDFIDFRVWPVFNIADSAIVAGVFVLGYYLLFLARDDMSEAKVASSKETA
jgi:signal peptidase II